MLFYTYFYPEKKHSLFHTVAFYSRFSVVSSVKAWFFKPSQVFTACVNALLPCEHFAARCEGFIFKAFTLETNENQ